MLGTSVRFIAFGARARCAYNTSPPWSVSAGPRPPKHGEILLLTSQLTCGFASRAHHIAQGRVPCAKPYADMESFDGGKCCGIARMRDYFGKHQIGEA
jgi:hypothetical protein